MKAHLERIFTRAHIVKDTSACDKSFKYYLGNRFARYSTVNGVEQRTLFKIYGIRFDVMVFGKVRHDYQHIGITSLHVGFK